MNGIKDLYKKKANRLKKSEFYACIHLQSSVDSIDNSLLKICNILSLFCSRKVKTKEVIYCISSIDNNGDFRVLLEVSFANEADRLLAVDIVYNKITYEANVFDYHANFKNTLDKLPLGIGLYVVNEMVGLDDLL